MSVQRLGKRGPIPRPIVERVTNLMVVDESGCHIWQGTLNTRGYPQMQSGSMVDGSRRPRRVHWLLWTELHGRPPEGFDIHHRCENKLCVNPGHLELLEHGEHTRIHRLLPDACKRGHPRTPENAYRTKRGTWQCKACKRLGRQRPYRDLPPEMRHAHDAVDWAVHKGRLIRQPCEVCGAEDLIVAHHDDYSKPLEVRWLCRQHHADVHYAAA